jgi:dTDP-glucose 4,6-dehydratase
MSRSLMITGGAGFIGTNFTWFWARRHANDSIVVVDALTYAGCAANISGLIESGSVTLATVDIRNEGEISRLIDAHAIDTVVHFAAESHVDRSIDGPANCVSTNVVGTQVLLDCARRAWSRRAGGQASCRFHHVSTDEVYGSLELDSPRFSETTAYAPRSPYSASKAASDHLVRAYGNTYGLPWTISNCSNNYGPYQYPEKLIPQSLALMLLGRPVPIYGTGRNVRDWLHVDDHCLALESILLGDRIGETFNIGGDAERTNIEIVTQLADLLDRAIDGNEALRKRYSECPATAGANCRSLIEFVRDRPGHDLRYAVDTAKILGALGFRPTVQLDTGLARTLQWYLENHDWWTSRLPAASQTPKQS